MWVAVEAAFDTHAGRLEHLSHQDLQWNDDFATTVDSMRKGMDQVDAKVGQQIGQVVRDLTATILKAENDLRLVVQEADAKFTDMSQRTREAFATVETAFGELQQRFLRTEEFVKKGLTVERQSGLFVDEATRVHEMSLARASPAPMPQPLLQPSPTSTAPLPQPSPTPDAASS